MSQAVVGEFVDLVVLAFHSDRDALKNPPRQRLQAKLSLLPHN
jgi:hypothetical protein